MRKRDVREDHDARLRDSGVISATSGEKTDVAGGYEQKATDRL